LENCDGKVWAWATDRSAKENWRLHYLVYNAIDMTTIRNKATTGKYEECQGASRSAKLTVRISLMHLGAILEQMLLRRWESGHDSCVR